MRLIDADALLEKQWEVESESSFDELISVVSVEDIINAPTIEMPNEPLLI